MTVTVEVTATNIAGSNDATSATSRGIYVSSTLTSYSAKVSNLPTASQISNVVRGGNAWVAVVGSAATAITSSVLS